MWLDQFEDVAGELRVGVFGLRFAAARSIGNDSTGIELLDPLRDGVPRPAEDGFRESRLPAQIVQADSSFKRSTF